MIGIVCTDKAMGSSVIREDGIDDFPCFSSLFLTLPYRVHLVMDCHAGVAQFLVRRSAERQGSIGFHPVAYVAFFVATDPCITRDANPEEQFV